MLTGMRTTITLDEDTAAAVDRIRHERHRGLSEVVNDLIRAGLRDQRPRQTTFAQRTHDLGLKIDVSNVAEAIELLEGPTTR